MGNDYRGVPIKQTPKQKVNFDATYHRVYGTRVKIPPPGPELDALVERIASKVTDASRDAISYVLDVLAEEEG